MLLAGRVPHLEMRRRLSSAPVLTALSSRARPNEFLSVANASDGEGRSFTLTVWIRLGLPARTGSQRTDSLRQPGHGAAQKNQCVW
jgi:hypothetical protein